MSGIYAWTHNQTGGVHFHRQAEPLRLAAEHGINVGMGNRLDDEICDEYDTILVHMLWDEPNSEAWEKLALNNQHRMIFDIDDAMWTPDWKEFKKHYTPEVLKRVYDNIKLAHVVTTPSENIAEYVRQFNPWVYVVPNTVPKKLLEIRTSRPERRIIGYQGSPSHITDVTAGLEDALGRILTEHPKWDLHQWGGDPDKIPPQQRHRYKAIPWQDNIFSYYKSLSMDIGLGPLAKTEFNACKSSLRAVEYAARGIPAVVTNWDPYIGWVLPNQTGLLVDNDDEWYEALKYLVENPEVRKKMSKTAKRLAKDWTTEANFGRWLEAWNSV